MSEVWKSDCGMFSPKQTSRAMLTLHPRFREHGAKILRAKHWEDCCDTSSSGLDRTNALLSSQPLWLVPAQNLASNTPA